MLVSAFLLPLGLLVSPVPQHMPAVMRQHHVVPRAAQPLSPSNRAGGIFPCDTVPTTSTLLAADVEQTPAEEADGKSRGRLILGVIVANSIFWQYILPIFKGQPTSTGRKKK